jgi:hypothetical protein
MKEEGRREDERASSLNSLEGTTVEVGWQEKLREID